MSIKTPSLCFCIGSIFILALWGCHIPKAPDYKVTKVKAPDLSAYDDIIQKIYTCNKSDQEMNLNLPRTDADILVQDTIENKEIIQVDCDQVKKSLGVGPVRSFDHVMQLLPPTGLTETVNYVVITNARTCTDQRLDAMKANAKDDDLVMTTKFEKSALAETGAIKLVLSDFEVRLSQMFLNVRDGNNLIWVKYYGKCLKYSDIPNTKSGDAYNCLEAQLIAEKSFLLNVEINRPTVDGSQEKSICYKK